MVAKKLTGTQVALSSKQKARLDDVVKRMSKALHIDLSRADAIERLCNLYAAGALDDAK